MDSSLTAQAGGIPDARSSPNNQNHAGATDGDQNEADRHIKANPVMCQTMNMERERKPVQKPPVQKTKIEPQKAAAPSPSPAKPVVCHTLGHSQKISIKKSEERSDGHAGPAPMKQGPPQVKRRPSADKEHSDEMILKAINEATDRTRKRAEQDLTFALEQQAEQHEQEIQEAIRKAVDDTLFGMQERVRVDDSKGFVRGDGANKRELKAMKQRCRELQDQTKKLTTEVDKQKAVAGDACDEARRAKTEAKQAKADEERARQALDRAQAQAHAQSKELAREENKPKVPQMLPHTSGHKSKEFKATALRTNKEIRLEKNKKDPKNKKEADFRTADLGSKKSKAERQRTKSVTFESGSRRSSLQDYDDTSLGNTVFTGLVFTAGESEGEVPGAGRQQAGQQAGQQGEVVTSFSINRQDYSQLDGLKYENNGLRSQLEEIEAKHDELVQAKVRELQDALESKDLSLAEALSRVSNLDTELMDVKKQLAQKEGVLRETEEQVRILEVQLKEMDQINYDLEREVKSVSQSLKELDGKLMTTEGKLQDTTTKYTDSLNRLKEVQEMSSKLDATAVAKLEAAVSSEQQRRNDVEQSANKTSTEYEQLRVSLTHAQDECSEAKQLAQSECRRSMMAAFAENSAKKQLAQLKKELQEAQELIRQTQIQAKEELERERKKVSKLQRELASTKEMLRASQKAHKKSPGLGTVPGVSSRHHGNSPQEVLSAARAQVFGRPHEIATKLNPLRQHPKDLGELDWEGSMDSSMSGGLEGLSMGSGGGLDVLNAARARIFGGQEDDVWSTLDVAMSPKIGSDLSSPIAEMDSMRSINEAIESELSKGSLGRSLTPITLTPI